MEPKLILFNGPRHCGKDTAALYCVKKYGAHHFKISRPLKAAIKSIFNLDEGTVDYLETIKTQPTPLLFGKSYVDLQISLSEDWFKQLYGPDVFGHLAVRDLASHMVLDELAEVNNCLYVCSDSGFAAEASPLVDLFGPENCLLVRVSRPGKTFAGDSRSYIELEGVPTVALSNDGSQGYYREAIENLIDYWLS
jgi:hypothetical protein